MADRTQLEKIRPCGRLETYSTAKHHLGINNNVGVAATYTAPELSTIAIESVIYSALKKLIDKHSALSTVVVNEDKSYPEVYFARLPTIDLRKCVEFYERKATPPKEGERDEELDELITEQHSRGFKEDLVTKPIWRLAVLTSPTDTNTFTAVWLFHHVISDGGSALVFHTTFLEALNSLSPNPDNDPIVKAPNTALTPPFEELLSLPISWPFMLKKIAAHFLPFFFDRRPAKFWTGNPVQKTISPMPKYHFRTLVLSADTTSRLAKLSRKENSSVTAILQCLIAASLLAHLPASKYDKVRLVIPVSLRRFIKDVKDDQLVNAVSSFECMHHRTPTPSPSPSSSALPQSTTPDIPAVLHNFSHPTARTMKLRAQSELAKRDLDTESALLKFVPDMLSFFTSRCGTDRGTSAELSNLGAYNPPRDGKWKISRVTFSQCPNPMNIGVGVNAVTGPGGEACLNFCWAEGVCEGGEGWVEKVIRGVEGGVRVLVGEVDV